MTSDGSLEVYTTAVPRPNGRWLEQVHLWSNGADHILYTYEAGPGGFAGRWSAHFILAFSPDDAYVAISDYQAWRRSTTERLGVMWLG